MFTVYPPGPGAPSSAGTLIGEGAQGTCICTCTPPHRPRTGRPPKWASTGHHSRCRSSCVPRCAPPWSSLAMGRARPRAACARRSPRDCAPPGAGIRAGWVFWPAFPKIAVGPHPNPRQLAWRVRCASPRSTVSLKSARMSPDTEATAPAQAWGFKGQGLGVGGREEGVGGGGGRGSKWGVGRGGLGLGVGVVAFGPVGGEQL